MNLPLTRLPTCDQCIVTYLLQSWIHLLTEIALQGSRSLPCSGIGLSKPKKKVSHSFGSFAASHVFLLSFCFHFCFSFNIRGCVRTKRYAKKSLSPRKHVNKALWNSSGNTSGNGWQHPPRMALSRHRSVEWSSIKGWVPGAGAKTCQPSIHLSQCELERFGGKKVIKRLLTWMWNKIIAIKMKGVFQR